MYISLILINGLIIEVKMKIASGKLTGSNIIQFQWKFWIIIYLFEFNFWRMLHLILKHPRKEKVFLHVTRSLIVYFTIYTCIARRMIKSVVTHQCSLKTYTVSSIILITSIYLWIWLCMHVHGGRSVTRKTELFWYLPWIFLIIVLGKITA